MFKLNFEDGTVFEGDSFKGDWAKAPEKKVKSLEYLYEGKRYVFQGFKQYIHLVQHDAGFGKAEVIKNIYIVGREENRSVILWFYLPLKRVIRILTPIGKEVCYESGGQVRVETGLLNGWKEGILDKPGISRI